jgi:glycosyltransferase involved in cell wall biosynthesis
VRVLVVNDLPLDAGWGGERHVRRLVAALRAAGDDVEVFAGEVVHHGAGKVRDLWDPVARRRLAARARGFVPDVVHHHNVVRELSVSVLGVPRGTPSVMTVHDHRLAGAADYPWTSPRGIADRLVKAPFDRAVARRRLAASIAVSRPLADRLRSRGFRDVSHVPVCGLTPTAALQPVAATRDVAFVGRLSPDKGMSVLADAFAAVATRHGDARLLVAGAGPDEDVVDRLARRLGPERVLRLGRLAEPDVSALLARVRVVVVPSIPTLRPEGSSLTAVEAALHGRAVLGSDDPAVAEVLTTLGADGVLPAGDAGALGAALDRLLADDGAATAAGDTARRNAERVYAPAAVADRVRAVHDRVAARASR